MSQTQTPDWQSLYDECSGKMLLFAKQFVQCAATAEDIVHDAFIRFWKNKSHREARNQSTWLYQCVRWTALDHIRLKKRERNRNETLASEQFLPEVQTESPCPIEKQEQAEQVENSLQQLPPKQREVIVLKVWAGLTFQEIADTLEISQNTAASRYRYGLEALKKEFTTNDYGKRS